MKTTIIIFILSFIFTIIFIGNKIYLKTIKLIPNLHIESINRIGFNKLILHNIDYKKSGILLKIDELDVSYKLYPLLNHIIYLNKLEIKNLDLKINKKNFTKKSNLLEKLNFLNSYIIKIKNFSINNGNIILNENNLCIKKLQTNLYITKNKISFKMVNILNIILNNKKINNLENIF